MNKKDSFRKQISPFFGDTKYEQKMLNKICILHNYEIKQLLETLKLPYSNSNPYGEYLQVKRHNGMIDELLNKLKRK